MEAEGEGEGEEWGEVGDEDERGEVFEVERIVGHKEEGGHRFFRIKWDGYGSEDNTWEVESNVHAKEAISDYFRRLKKEEANRKRRAEKADKEGRQKDRKHPTPPPSSPKKSGKHKDSAAVHWQSAEGKAEASRDSSVSPAPVSSLPLAALSSPAASLPPPPPARCDVCWEGATAASPLIGCTACGVQVHPSCYLLPSAPTPDSSWRCAFCSASTDAVPVPECCLCPVKGGAVWPTSEPSGLFAHAACALWVHEMDAGPDAVRLSLIDEQRLSLRCVFCDRGGGEGQPVMQLTSPILCAIDGCDQTFHVSCGRQNGAAMRLKVIEDQDARYALCAQHSQEDIDAEQIPTTQSEGAAAIAAVEPPSDVHSAAADAAMEVDRVAAEFGADVGDEAMAAVPAVVRSRKEGRAAAASEEERESMLARRTAMRERKRKKREAAAAEDAMNDDGGDGDEEELSRAQRMQRKEDKRRLKKAKSQAKERREADEEKASDEETKEAGAAEAACFSVDDSQILTEGGFLGFDEVRRRLCPADPPPAFPPLRPLRSAAVEGSAPSLRVGCFDVAKSAVQFLPITWADVIHRKSRRLLRFHSSTQDGVVDLRCTADHELFARTGQADRTEMLDNPTGNGDFIHRGI